jgi:hypothetical protein
MGRYVTRIMNKYICALNQLKENPDISRIDNDSSIDIAVFIELHNKGLVNAIDVSNKSYEAFIEPSISIDGDAFLEEHNSKVDTPTDWYKKPIGMIFISVSAITIAWFLKLLIGPYIS